MSNIELNRMGPISIIVFQLFLIIVVLCHVSNFIRGRHNLKIINGSVAKPGQFPSLVSLQLENGEGHFCGGTIINAKHIFTAAHCIVAHNKDDIENKMIIIAGDTRLKRNTTSSRQERYPELIILHSYFNEFTLEDDAAIIRITHRFQFNEFVHAVPLSKSKPGLGTVCVIAGWGVTSPNGKGPVSDKLLYAKVYVVEGDYCDYSPDYKFKPDKMICGGVLGGGRLRRTILL
ncbi:chymotrypsin-2-like isoform X2 [Hermetia illucens]|uniref:chymotrypsin-2-like isoform X2 n=1 Tax=Hermetia illucens TaxID=343691 RepID=UPI0018CBF4EF|nr:chymotrypsin-2-like isoform X2 [Hermetia illucens]